MNSAQCKADLLRRVSPQRSSPLLDAMIAEREAFVEAGAEIITRYES
jgi:hypothetical protein